jgi:hypothetical protein
MNLFLLKFIVHLLSECLHEKVCLNWRLWISSSRNPNQSKFHTSCPARNICTLVHTGKIVSEKCRKNRTANGKVLLLLLLLHLYSLDPRLT